MNVSLFVPTQEQEAIIMHEGSAFIAACPGAGKTRVMVERARRVIAQQSCGYGRGLAFLSFTGAAVSELEARLYREGVVQKPAFPHFIGTFDGFLWRFLIAPFGAPSETRPARLIPDKNFLDVVPFPGARALPLGCIDRTTGLAIQKELEERRFAGNIRVYEVAARRLRATLLEEGQLDFEDARQLALDRLKDPARSQFLVDAFAARFTEVIVDEAQDCNALDLSIISLLRSHGITVKVICDPNQAIYGFRGGVGQELARFASTFSDEERLPMTGNFRSGKNIAKCIWTLRTPAMRRVADEALGPFKDETSPVHVLAYGGNSVPRSVGIKFAELVRDLGFPPASNPIVASTLASASKAAGVPCVEKEGGLSITLATTVHTYHSTSDMRAKRDALVEFHKIQLEIGEALAGRTYQQYISENKIEPNQWRPSAIEMLEAMRFDSSQHGSASQWLKHTKGLLDPLRRIGSSKSINQWLPNRSELEKVFAVSAGPRQLAQTIHAVKGLEFDAICVVMTSKHTKTIIDLLSSAPGDEDSENARKIYVGASRARRLLAIAIPKSQGERLKDLLTTSGAEVKLSQV
ncbi:MULTISPECIES: ATP-dependent helicase [Xanthomonas]|uniref:ATP-dependent helicase n=1 Tax=Xanthomonas TaxID=338 RepID=UPI001ADCFBF9|nr:MULTISPECIES: ATP-dependent helicase [unclassified Xanthomonas]MBO9873527.1 ATP-dependent helicase [Xanthomonas sp. D-93]WNH45308.1 ATP-dependent helicase [Xanthomonas sp. A6251]